MVQYIEHIFQQFVNVKIVTCLLCIGKTALCVLGRVGPDSNRDRLMRCPFEIWFVCCLPVKMVCPCVNV